MERTASYFTVGLSVILACLALIGFMIWLAGGARDFGRTARYTVYFTDPISGLSEEAPVKYRGVDVGRILRTRLAPDATNLVKVDIEVSEAGLKAIAYGEPMDPARHEPAHEVKAITYHDLKVEQTADGWLAEVIVDI